MEHAVQIIVPLITACIGPLIVAWVSRKWSEEDRALADEKDELAQAALEKASSERSEIRDALALLLQSQSLASSSAESSDE